MSQLSVLSAQKEMIKNQMKGLETAAININDSIEKIAKDILLGAIITGTEFTVKHGMIAPYSHGYYITSKHVEEGYCRTVSSGGLWYKDLVDVLYEYLTEGENWDAEKFETLSSKVDEAFKSLPTSYNKDAYGPDDSLHGHHIANGYETDGFKNIISGRCGGTYSSYTTGTQNDLARELCVLRGFGADYYLDDIDGAFRNLPIKLVESTYRKIGILESDEHLDDTWCDNHPERCIED